MTGRPTAGVGGPGSADRVLLRRVAAAFERRDPVPAAATSAARRASAGICDAGLGWLALLADGPPVAGLRGPRGGHLLGFAGEAGGVDVELAADGPRRVRVTGLVSLARPGGLAIRWPGGTRAVGVDRFGRFAAGGLPAGPLSLAVSRPGRPDAVTPWFVA